MSFFYITVQLLIITVELLSTFQECLAEAGLANIVLHPCPLVDAYRGPLLDLGRFTEVSNYHFITALKPLGAATTAE